MVKAQPRSAEPYTQLQLTTDIWVSPAGMRRTIQPACRLMNNSKCFILSQWVFRWIIMHQQLTIQRVTMRGEWSLRHSKPFYPWDLVDRFCPIHGLCLVSLSFKHCLGRLTALRTSSSAWTLSLALTLFSKTTRAITEDWIGHCLLSLSEFNWVRCALGSRNGIHVPSGTTWNIGPKPISSVRTCLLCTVGWLNAHELTKDSEWYSHFWFWSAHQPLLLWNTRKSFRELPGVTP